jgi:hypothetical protein
MMQRFVAVLLLAGSCLAQTDRKEVTVSPDILARYVGIYAMGPGVKMTITLN